MQTFPNPTTDNRCLRSGRREPGLKLVIQIPCLNEESYLPRTLADLPKTVPGVAEVKILVIDDGSTDRTAEVARRHGVGHVVRFKKHRGLGRAFDCGIRYALALDADIIVNTDADNQYAGRCIPGLIRPLLDGSADFTIGVRPIDDIPHFSLVKKQLQKLGSGLVSKLAGIPIRDATSGFRAFNRRAASRMRIASGFTYTAESILLASRHGLRIAQVPVEVNPRLRESRLARNTWDYLLRSSGSLLRTLFLCR